MKKFKDRLKETDKILLLLLVFMLFYIVYFTYFTFTKHDLFLTGRYDVGNMDQTVWNTIHGRIFTLTNPDYNLVMSRLSIHADFILILLAPLYLIWEDPKMLLLVQTVILSLGALFVYLLGKDVLKQKLIPLGLALSFLLNPFVERQNIFEFHSVVLATTFLLACFYFLQKNKYIPFFIFLILAVLCKEHIYAVAGILGLYILIVKKKKWGILLSLISFTIFYLLISKFIPDARSANHFALAFYDDYGSSPVEIIKTFFINPSLSLSMLMKNNVLIYYKNLFFPVGFLSLLSPLYIIFALPELLINSLTNNPNWRTYVYHYSPLSQSFIYISAIFGVKKILSHFPKKSIVIFLYIFIFMLAAAYLYGPLPGTREADPSLGWGPENRQLITDYLKTIPSDAKVASTNNLGAHLSHRQYNYSLTADYPNAEYVLLLVPANSIEDIKNKDGDVERGRALLQNPKYKLIYRLSNFLVFKKA